MATLRARILKSTALEGLPKIWRLLDSKRRLEFIGLLFLMILGAVLEGIGVAMFLPILTLLINPSDSHFGPALTWLRSHFPTQSPDQLGIEVAVALAGLYLFKTIYLWEMYRVQAKFIYSNQIRFSRRLFESYLHGPYVLHVHKNTAELLYKTVSEITTLFTGLLAPLLLLLSEASVTFVVVIVTIIVSPLWVLAFLLSLGLIGAKLYHDYGVKLENAGTQRQLHLGEAYQSILESLGGIKEIKILGREAYFEQKFLTHCDEYSSSAEIYAVYSQLTRLWIELMVAIGLLALVAGAVKFGGGLRPNLPALGLLVVAILRIMPSVNRIFYQMASLRYYLPTLEKISLDLSTAEPITPLPASSTAEQTPLRLETELALENVAFKYPGSERPAIQEINLRIAKGSSIAIVGRSGTGKTTLLNMILGLLKPTQGRILADGKDLDATNLGRAWQRSIGYVPQSVFLLDNTLRRNIAFGIPDAEIKDDEVWTAARAARLEDWIQSLPEGLNTKAGERGTRISGGEIQRIGIARALFHKPEVLVLDEATSSLDAETESKISDALDQLSHDKTLIFIAHRTLTMKRCQRLFFLRDGRLAAEGSFDELLRSNESFRSMIQEERAPS